MRPLLLLALLLAAGCTVLRAPKVTVQKVAVTQATDEGLGVTVELELSNPNREPVPLYDFLYALRVEGKDVYHGRRTGGATLGPLGTRSMTLPAVIAYERLSWTPEALPDVARFELSGELRYVAPAVLIQILFDAGTTRPGVGFDGRGDLEIRAAAAPPGN